ncbi:MAG: hypothetical protein UY48_C0013G0003 [Candidatus Gottesmanbacteria bacterium GW2011_GWB1_49_7]|uniref:Uncharacterized protein n=1 Tax=Candidatus Gottesmanbacteria bacterium GW2011_GWB1_49_7 TaxID=1618448 RepID=A0A0G1Y9Z4_9BACT|nr:MAG: hypothetical protein UY48_C0013G0003 [Candidatus Gottesmanbacteria bacterium GW2011_GWB1_49_7]
MTPETELSLEFKRKAKERIDALIAVGEWSKLTMKERVYYLIITAEKWREQHDGETGAAWDEVAFILDIAEFIQDASTADPFLDYREEIA